MRGALYGVETGLVCGARVARKAVEMGRSSNWGDCWFVFGLLAGVKGYLTLASSKTAVVVVAKRVWATAEMRRKRMDRIGIPFCSYRVCDG